MKELDIIWIVLCCVDVFFLWGTNYTMQGRGLKFAPLVPYGALIFIVIYLAFGHPPAEILSMAKRSNNPELFDFVLRLFVSECVATFLYHAVFPIHSKNWRVTVTSHQLFGMIGTYVKTFNKYDEAEQYQWQSWSYPDVINVKLEPASSREIDYQYKQWEKEYGRITKER